MLAYSSVSRITPSALTLCFDTKPSTWNSMSHQSHLPGIYLVEAFQTLSSGDWLVLFKKHRIVLKKCSNQLTRQKGWKENWSPAAVDTLATFGSFVNFDHFSSSQSIRHNKAMFVMETKVKLVLSYHSYKCLNKSFATKNFPQWRGCFWKHSSYLSIIRRYQISNWANFSGNFTKTYKSFPAKYRKPCSHGRVKGQVNAASVHTKQPHKIHRQGN